MAGGDSATGRSVTGDRLNFALAVCIGVMRPFAVLFTKRDWRGAEHLPKEGGCVVAVNHVSEVDPFTVGHFVYDNGRLPRFLAKVEVFNVPLLGRLLRSAGQIPVLRRTADAAKAFKAAVDSVYAGRCVIVYPEGTISRDPDLWPMVGKTGAARIALTTGCPLVPVAQWGAQDILAPYARRPHLLPRKVVKVAAGPPIDLSDLAGQPLTPAVLQTATDRLLDAVTALLEESRGGKAPAERFDPRRRRRQEREGTARESDTTAGERGGETELPA